MSDQPTVTVPVKPWYKSRELVAALVQFAVFLAAGVESAIKAGNSVSVMLLVAAALAAFQATMKANAANIITGLPIFDGPKPDATIPGPIPEPKP